MQGLTRRFLVKVFGVINSVLLIFQYRLVKVNYMFKAKECMEPDYVRFSTFALISDEIKRNALAGDVAELGVFRGDFARHINKAFSDKTFYLFDTFAGFDKKDVDIEQENSFSDGAQDFSDTSVQIVMKKMKNPQNCKFIKGYFPDSLSKLPDNKNLQFCFVSIDADLYAPIYEGLSYFYPLLCKGGYIMVHDYNSKRYNGVKEAVHKFMSETPVLYVPIADPSGSVVIVKN